MPDSTVEAVCPDCCGCGIVQPGAGCERCCGGQFMVTLTPSGIDAVLQQALTSDAPTPPSGAEP